MCYFHIFVLPKFDLFPPLVSINNIDLFVQESPTHFYGKLKCGKSSGTTVAYVCYKCNKFFTTLKAVQAHGKNHTDTPFSCDKCDKKFLCEKGFQRHTLRHSVFYCEYCDKKFNKVNITEYVVHKDLKHSIKCSLCDKSFVTEGKMLRHCHSMHPESKLPFKCNQCEERFSSQHKLKRHTEEHEIRAERVAAEKQLRKHRCSFCGELCHGVKGLAAHYRTHMVGKKCFQNMTCCRYCQEPQSYLLFVVHRFSQIKKVHLLKRNRQETKQRKGSKKKKKKWKILVVILKWPLQV